MMSESDDDLIVMIEETIDGLDEEIDSEEITSHKSLKERIISKRFLFNATGILLSILLMIIILRVSFGSLQVIQAAESNPWQYQLFLAFFFCGAIIGLFSFKLKDSIIIAIGLMGLTFIVTFPILIRELVENVYPLVVTLFFTLIFLFLALLLFGAFLAYEVKDYIKWLYERRKLTKTM